MVIVNERENPQIKEILLIFEVSILRSDDRVNFQALYQLCSSLALFMSSPTCILHIFVVL